MTRPRMRVMRGAVLAALWLSAMSPRSRAAEHVLTLTFTNDVRVDALSAFPVLVTLGPHLDGFSYADFLSADGADLRFWATPDRVEELVYEIERWDPGGVSYVWVRVPAPSAGGEFMASWGNGAHHARQPYTTNGAAWNVGFAGVWHMGSTNAADSTSAAAHAVPAGRVFPEAGMIDGAVALDTTAPRGYLQAPNHVGLNPTAQLGLSAWVRPTAVANNGVMMKGAMSSSQGAYSLILYNAAQFRIAGVTRVSSTANIPLNAWTHLYATYDGSQVRIYTNGNLSATANYSAAVPVDTNPLVLGGYFSSSYTMPGVLDEVRVENLARSSNWVWACWANQSPGQGFLTYSEVLRSPGPVIDTDAGAAGVTSTSAWLQATLTATGNLPTAVWSYWGATPGGATESAWSHTNFFGVNALDPPVAYSNLASGLSSNTLYYYTFRAASDEGTNWAAESSFYTLGVPAVSTPPPTGVTGDAATLRATLVLGGTADLTIYWGASDGGTVPSQWSHTNALGSADIGETLSVNVDLGGPGVYYVRAYATNTYGESWAETTLRFVTTVEDVIYVDGFATGDGDGSSWGHAFTRLEQALAAASSGKQFWVARGTYTPTPGTDRNATFQMVSGVALYGGFKGDETDLSQRDWARNVTTLSGEIGGETVYDNSLHVITWTGAADARLDGFTVTRGYAWDPARDSEPHRNGGAILLHQSEVFPYIANCRFVDNAANFQGGAIFLNYNADGSVGPVITNCYFEGNYTFRQGGAWHGGAIYMFHRKPITIVDSTFVDNRAGDGGAYWSLHSDPSFIRCTFADNQASGYGGAIYAARSDVTSINHTRIVDSVFYNNRCDIFGGALYWDRFNHTGDLLSNTWFYANSSGQHGSMAAHLYRVRGVVADCVFSGNRSSAIQPAGALYLHAANPRILRTAVVGNRGLNYGAGILGRVGSQPLIENTISAGNEAHGRGAGLYMYDAGSLLSATHCTFVENRTTSTGANDGGGGLFLLNGTFSITNTILYGNRAAAVNGSQIAAFTATVDLRHNAIEDGVAGVYASSSTIVDAGGNLADDPQLAVMAGVWTAAGVVDAAAARTTYTDATANWTPGSLAGKFLNPDANGANLIYYIATNTATTLTILGKTTGSGGAYRIYGFGLRAGSPAVDSGDPAAAPATDYAGVLRPQGAGVDMGAFESVFDSAPPGNVTDLAAVPAHGQVALTWTNPGDVDFDGVLILRREGAAPSGAPVDTNRYVVGASLGDGVVVYAGSGASATPGAGSGWTDTGLNNGTDYHYLVCAHDGLPNYASGAGASATPAEDQIAPDGVSGLVAEGGDRQIALAWTNPGDADFAGVLILRRAGTEPPTGAPDDWTTYSVGQPLGDGVVVYAGPGADAAPGSASGWTDTGLDNAASYTYAVFAHDEAPNYAGGANAGATTDGDTTAPGAVIGLTATPGMSLIALDWWNPDDADFAGVLIVRRVGAEPTGAPADGVVYSAGQALGDATVVYAGSGTDGVPGAPSAWTDTSVTNGTLYVYKVFARDEVPNYASPAVASATPTDAAVIYVNHAAVGANDGTSWNNAFISLQSALNAATAGRQIWVARGTYTPGAARSDTFQMKTGVDLYGGFFGDESALDQRDWNAFPTILSGQIGSAAATDNSLHVITGTGADRFRLDGFTVTRGYAWNSSQDSDPHRDGGGLVINGTRSYPTIANCRFVDNAANYLGGAIYMNYPGGDFTGPMITNTVFESNYTFRAAAAYNGGAIYVFHRVITTIADCTFTDNQALEGGAIYTEHGELRISNSTFARNTAISSRGGAILHLKSSSEWLRESWLLDCDFHGNTAVHWGGAVHWSRYFGTGDRIAGCRFFDNQAQQRNANALYLLNFDGTLENCLFSGNRSTTSDGEGGALYLLTSDPVLRNSIFAGTQTGHRGGAIYGSTSSRLRAENLLIVGNRSRYDGAGAALFDLGGTRVRSASFVNCTIADNVSYEANAAYGGGGLYLRNGEATLRNTLLYGNAAAILGDQVHVALVNTIVHFDHNLIAGGLGAVHNPNGATLTDLGGNIDANPGFEQQAGVWTANSVYSGASGRTVLTDSGANWEPGRLVGQFVNPDTATANYAYYIEANSATTLTVLGQAVGGVTAPYRIRDYRLPSGSPAIDVGAADGTANDLEGTSRPQPLGGDMDIGAFEYAPDGEPPDNIANLGMLEGAEQIQFNWTSPTNSDFNGVLVLRRVGDAPTGTPTDTNTYSVGSSIGDGQVVFLSTGVEPGGAAGWTDTSLNNGVDYHYRFFAYDGIPNYASGVATNGSPADDNVPPADVSGLVGVGGDRQIALAWTNPADADFTGVLIVRRANFAHVGAPVAGQFYNANDSIGNGTVVYAGPGANAAPGAASGWTDTGLNNGATFVYRVYAHDEVPNYAGGVSTNVTTLIDSTPPGPVTSLGATPGDSAVALTWFNPSAADFEGVLILRRAGDAPTGTPTHTNTYTVGQTIGDGEVIYVGGGNNPAPNASSGFTDSVGLANGITYHYRVFARDEVPNYSTPAGVSATPQVLNAIYVDAAGAGPLYNGTSWDNAFTNLQDALAVATAGKNIWVAQGTYKPGAARTDAFVMVNDVNMYGGFISGMDSVTQRDWEAYPTILSGDIDDNGLLDSGNSYQVVRGANNAALDGFVVTMGYADGASDPYRGGGGFAIWNTAQMPSIRNCRFVNNAGWIYGGAVMLRFSTGGTDGVVISNCTFEANYTWFGGHGGGGVYQYHRRRLTIADSTFTDNVASNGNGGAVYSEFGHPNIHNSTFARNRAPNSYGGAVWNTADLNTPLLAAMSLSNCVFNANECNVYGAAVYLSRGGNSLGDLVTDCDFYGNRSRSYDGILFLQSFKGNVRNSRFSGNRVSTGNSRGGAISLESSDCELDNVIVVGTDGGARGGGLYGGTDSRPRIQNALFAGNRVRYDGAGICLFDLAATEVRSATLINSTVSRNRTWDSASTFGGGGVYTRLGTLDLRNTIVYDNAAAGNGQNVFVSQAASTLNVAFNDLGGGVAAIHNPQGATINNLSGNIDEDPLFVGGPAGTWTAGGVFDALVGETVLTDAGAAWEPGALAGKFLTVNEAVEDLLFLVTTNDATTATVWGFATNAAAGAAYRFHDFRLTTGSPCVDGGTNFGPSVDLVGVARPQPAGGTYDIGAYERPTILLSIHDATVTEGALNTTTTMVFLVTLTSAAEDEVSVEYATADGTATVADNDYVATSGTLIIPAGESGGQIEVTVNGDNKDEGIEEYFFVNLTDPVNAAFGDNQGRGTIIDDDTAPPPPPGGTVLLFR